MYNLITILDELTNKYSELITQSQQQEESQQWKVKYQFVKFIITYTAIYSSIDYFIEDKTLTIKGVRYSPLDKRNMVKSILEDINTLKLGVNNKKSVAILEKLLRESV